ncbi:hypothetical protein GCM10007049_03940 [Echinicola pacifica]|uniref:Uncharacterized protein n=1 Tax=Echinicola pacifica TaxID=346377 RepID=A0A918PLC1_9BACT|nr:hypothetical protein GCM10007049_03940 [Echinicola pacifica]
MLVLPAIRNRQANCVVITIRLLWFDYLTYGMTHLAFGKDSKHLSGLKITIIDAAYLTINYE